jgi:hypothetical protein
MDICQSTNLPSSCQTPKQHESVDDSEISINIATSKNSNKAQNIQQLVSSMDLCSTYSDDYSTDDSMTVTSTMKK